MYFNHQIKIHYPYLKKQTNKKTKQKTQPTIQLEKTWKEKVWLKFQWNHIYQLIVLG